MEKRDEKIDFIRALCMLTVILAHVGAPDLINQIRVFDVIALVLLSGMSMSMKKEEPYAEYLRKRINKLLIPTYLMMIFVFVMSYIMCFVMNVPQLYSFSRIIRSFLLLYPGSMGYVWIVRVFLIIAIASPLIVNIDKVIKKDISFLIYIICGAFFLHFIRVIGTRIGNELAAAVFNDYVYSSLVYVLIAQIGFRVKKNTESKKMMMFMAVVAWIMTEGLLSFVHREFFFRQGDYKFPPEFYYCIYGVAITLVLYNLIPKISNKYFLWLSKNSFSIYIWHIIVLRVVGIISKVSLFSVVDDLWVLKYIIVLTGAIVLTVFEKLVEKHLRENKICDVDA